MKPVGLTDPRTGRRPYAVVQLRQDNALGTLWNMVGFQTKLKHGEQTRIFRMIPGLENAELRAARRPAPQHLHQFAAPARSTALRLKAEPRIRFAGQITGVEGYVESAAIGLLAGRFAAGELLGAPIAPPPPTTALGALLAHITQGADAKDLPADEREFRLVSGARCHQSACAAATARKRWRIARWPISMAGLASTRAAAE